MQISSNLNDLKTHNLSKPGSYEWWYFDFIDENSDYSFVVIFFTSFLFSPRYIKKTESGNEFNINDYCAVNVCVYRENKILDYFLIEYDRNDLKFTESENEYTVNIAQNSINFVTTDNVIKVYLSCNLINPVNGKKIKIKCELTPLITNDDKNTDFSGDEFSDKWYPAFPKCKISGKIYLDRSTKNQRSVKKILVEGTGYADKNWSDKPIYKDIDDWSWGRCHLKEYTIIFFRIIYSHKVFNKFLIYKNDKLIVHKENFNINSVKKRNYWRLEYPSEIQITDSEVSLVIKNKNLIDNGPFYIRFNSEFDLKINSDSVSGNGFFEIIKPARLLNKFLHPFINLRIKSKE
ncbi:MAG TPA: hypothetical protein PLG90_12505 [Ignavibacteria bacterium]|nr:hypothetical protein [Ignavibacteria bacterium]